jgi:ubiquinone/menaquinone biosynthesis C-methylase UbiE
MDERWDHVYQEEVRIYDTFSRAEDDGDRVLQTLLGHISFSDKVVVDAGCGSGRFAAEIAPRCRHFLGLDLSWALLSYARQQGRQLHNVNFFQARFEEIPLPDNSVDLLFSTWAVDPHAFNPQRTDPTVEMSRVTREPGSVWLAINHWEGAFMEMRGAEEQKTTRSGLQMLQERGFTLVEKVQTSIRFGDMDEARHILGFIFGTKAVNYLEQHQEPEIERVVAILRK